MPDHNFLTSKQKKALQKALKSDSCPYFREHALILLLLNDGKTHKEVAELIGCGVRTVDYWFVHGDPNNLDSLRDKRAQGNYQKATDEYINLLLEVVEKSPQEVGYEFGSWSGERLATYLATSTGIQLSGSQVRRILKKKKFSYIWAKYSLDERQNSSLRKEFRQKLNNYLAIAQQSPELLQVWFWDESGFSLRVIRRKTWGKKGTRKKISGLRRRGRVNVMGGLRISDKKRLCFFIKQGNGESFFEQLKQLQNFVLQEWVNQGKSAEYFSSQGPKIIVILDNASWHKRLDILENIKKI